MEVDREGTLLGVNGERTGPAERFCKWGGYKKHMKENESNSIAFCMKYFLCETTLYTAGLLVQIQVFVFVYRETCVSCIQRSIYNYHQ